MMIKELKKRGEEILNRMEEEFNTPRIHFKKVLVEGETADEIVKTAENEGGDIIIIGTGKIKIDKPLRGSVTEKVVHSAPCSVLLLRTEKE